MKIRTLLFIPLFILFFTLPAFAADRILKDDPMIGNSLALPVHLLVVSNVNDWGMPAIAGNPKYSATTLEQMQSCSGCPHDKFKMERVYAPGTKFKVTQVIFDDKSWYQIDSSAMRFLTVQAPDGLSLTAPEFMFSGGEAMPQSMQQENMLSEFKNPAETRKYYLQDYLFSMLLTQSTTYPECSGYEQKIAPVLAKLKEYKVSVTAQDSHSCSLEVTADQAGLAYILSRKNDWSLAVSPML